MVGRGDGDDVDILAFKEAPHVLARFDGDPLVVPFLFFLAEDGIIDISEAGAAASLELGESADVTAAASAKADNGDAHVIVGAGNLGPGFGRSTDGGGGDD